MNKGQILQYSILPSGSFRCLYNTGTGYDTVIFPYTEGIEAFIMASGATKEIEA